MNEYDRLYERISDLIPKKDQILIGIDGSCASGKTTLAGEIERLFDCNVLHMDDFFLPTEMRTEARLSEIGGNVDYERFHDEVLLPLLNRESFSYRPYDCETDSLKEPVRVHPMRLSIIEGTYSLHPRLAFAYDLSVCLTVSPRKQMERISERDPRLHRRFFEEWIPLEQHYFVGSVITQRCDMVIDTTNQNQRRNYNEYNGKST